MPYTELYYHLVWRTKHKRALITPELEPVIYASITDKLVGLGGQVIAIGGMPDHVHVVAYISPTVALAEAVRQMKGASSHAAGSDFQWQGEYGAFTVSKRTLPQAVEYVRNQKAHHTKGTTHPAVEPPHEDEPSSP